MLSEDSEQNSEYSTRTRVLSNPSCTFTTTRTTLVEDCAYLYYVELRLYRSPNRLPFRTLKHLPTTCPFSSTTIPAIVINHAIVNYFYVRRHVQHYGKVSVSESRN